MPARARLLVLGGAVLALSACTPVASVQFDTVTPSDQSRATVVAEPSGAKKVDPGQTITVKATAGQLTDVQVVGPKGPLKGQISSDGTVWTAKKETLAFGSTYEVEATAVDQRGIPTTTTETIRTKEPRGFYSAVVSPRDGGLVGVGMPITVTFDRAIQDKAAVEGAMVIYTPEPIEGAWSWASDTQAQFRPKKYWPGNIDVTVDLNLKGVESAKRVYGQKNTEVTFSVGPRMITKVDALAHTATVKRDGELVRTIPITTGKEGFETRSGIKVIVSKERTRVMDAATGGTEESDPEYYNIEVEYAMRVTYSGEFVHAAPWSVGSQGRANVSHGCIGMSTANAQWLYDLSNVGDVVEVTGTTNPQNLGNGITVWNEDWQAWLADSATGPVMTVAAPVEPTPDLAEPAPQTAPDGSDGSDGADDLDPAQDSSTGVTAAQQASYGR